MRERPAIEIHASEFPRPYRPAVTAAILTWGDHPDLVERCFASVRDQQSAVEAELVIAANEPSPAVEAWLKAALAAGMIDRLLLARRNCFKYPMLREVIRTARGDDLWWFDDDVEIRDPQAGVRWRRQVEISSPKVVLWGSTAFTYQPTGFEGLEAARDWVSSARWYRGLPPPSSPGTDPRWGFVLGHCWWARLSALRALDWPDPRLRHLAGDVMLGEALRQQDWGMMDLPDPGVDAGSVPRRGSVDHAVPLPAEPVD